MAVLSIAACTNENTSKKDNSASAPATNIVAPIAEDVIVSFKNNRLTIIGCYCEMAANLSIHTKIPVAYQKTV